MEFSFNKGIGRVVRPLVPFYGLIAAADEEAKVAAKEKERTRKSAKHIGLQIEGAGCLIYTLILGMYIGLAYISQEWNPPKLLQLIDKESRKTKEMRTEISLDSIISPEDTLEIPDSLQKYQQLFQKE